MRSNSVMFILLFVFVITTIIALVMCFMRNNDNLNVNFSETNEEESLINHVKNMNRTYNRFYWGNNELH